MNKTYWKRWWKAAGIRAIKTVAQAAVGAISGKIAFQEVDWRYIVGLAVLAGVVSLLTSLAGLPEVKMEEEIDYDSE